MITCSIVLLPHASFPKKQLSFLSYNEAGIKTDKCLFETVDGSKVTLSIARS